MKKWEYMSVNCLTLQEFDQNLNRLGEDGWKMISFFTFATSYPPDAKKHPISFMSIMEREIPEPFEEKLKNWSSLGQAIKDSTDEEFEQIVKLLRTSIKTGNSQTTSKA
ncbi:MAG: hypothetical protein CEN87_748 [Parcubacteria group bacterium Licking1014_1]|nr:MAG: hypothetical protein CEN87_748 [Parcubacteria group bacterium Licking1014_1]